MTERLVFLLRDDLRIARRLWLVMQVWASGEHEGEWIATTAAWEAFRYRTFPGPVVRGGAPA
jgi:hypothetical protein